MRAVDESTDRPGVIQGVADLEAIRRRCDGREVALAGFMAVHSPRSRWPRRSSRATSRASTSTRPAPRDAHLAGDATPVEPALVTELLDLTAQGAVVDDTFLHKQPDWTYGGDDSGRAPVERFTDHRAE